MGHFAGPLSQNKGAEIWIIKTNVSEPRMPLRRAVGAGRGWFPVCFLVLADACPVTLASRRKEQDPGGGASASNAPVKVWGRGSAGTLQISHLNFSQRQDSSHPREKKGMYKVATFELDRTSFQSSICLRTGSYCVAHAGSNLLILLPQSPRCRDYRHELLSQPAIRSLIINKTFFKIKSLAE